ncbi:phospholipid:lipid A palmitoyltransferase [Rahnella sp. SAP-1]|uniref:Lipid A acyltransferase PagP n=2 Tax=Rouxiella aceris TaxID=2703884 RepID=A0A848MEE8_9GAMM|nr:lipid IV(A) palmitoyltransferase PagP [Rouxiella aceris]NMP26055.1 phospholipid:lipid A palmitoyltransferase [Rouxiella aceris]
MLKSLLFCLLITPVIAEAAAPVQTSENTSSATHSGFNRWWSSWKNDVATTWQSPQHQDLYFPAITWHNRATYDRAKIDRYNERPWGGGYGISRYDENGDWHGLYFMAFKDSFNKWEPIGGYGYEKIWRPLQDPEFKLGLGYTAAITARDNYNYIPLPLILPLASVGYDRFTFQATYIPGTHNNGNVFFAWVRFQF